MRTYSYANLLHPDVFVSARYLEAELVRVCKELFSSTDETVGITTSGGTESILSAMLAHRNRGFKKGIEHPEMYYLLI
jgi:sphinganine-1-phosphate aldolase